MTNEYRYKLDKSSKKHPCPDCHKRTFVRYIDTETGNHLPDQYGRCDREVNCSYHLNPYLDGYTKMIREQERGNYSDNWKPQQLINRPKPALKPEPAFIPLEVFKRTLKPEGYEQNVFVQNLLSRVSFPFDAVDVEGVISQYYLGTVCNGYRAGGITFPFMDKGGNIRAIQVKQFDQANHTTGTDFLHSIIEKHHQKKSEALPGWLEAYQRNEIKVSSLFGEHLLSKHRLNPIALVEAPKTAVYGTLYLGFPENPGNLLWLAVYNLSSLNFEKCKALQGRDVYLFPDLSKEGKAFELWNRKAKELSELMPGTRFEVSGLLETLAPDALREQGADIADVLIKMDWQRFRPKQIEVIQEAGNPVSGPIPAPKSEKGENGEASKQTYFFKAEPLPSVMPEPTAKRLTKDNNWGISELETFFGNISVPTQPIKLNPYSTITDIAKFIETHLATLNANNGKRTFLPYLNRLQELKEYLTINLN